MFRTFSSIFVFLAFVLPARGQAYDNTIAALRLEPLSEDVCPLYLRYEAISSAYYNLYGEGAPYKGRYPDTTKEEVEQLRRKAIREYAQALVYYLYVPLEFEKYDFPLKCNNRHGNTLVNPVAFHNSYDVAKRLLWIVRSERNKGIFTDREIPDEYDIEQRIVRYAAEWGPKLRNEWKNTSRLEVNIPYLRLKELLMEHKISPEHIGLSQSEAGKLLNGGVSGKKRKWYGLFLF